jgi:hypothetical protein
MSPCYELKTVYVVELAQSVDVLIAEGGEPYL